MYIQRWFYIADTLCVCEIGFKNKYFHKSVFYSTKITVLFFAGNRKNLTSRLWYQLPWFEVSCPTYLRSGSSILP